MFGTGPSLNLATDAQWAVIDKDVTIGVNNIAASHEVDYVLASDGNTHIDCPHYLNNAAKKIFMLDRYYDHVEHIKNTASFKRASTPSRRFEDGLYIRYASGHAALNLALIMGCDPIILLGFDYRALVHAVPTGRDRPTKQWSDFPRKAIGQVGFKYFAGIIKELGRTVLNANPDSAVECFPKVSLKEILDV